MNRFALYKLFKQAALLTGCLFVFGCENDINEVNKMTGTRSMVEEAKDVQSLLSQNGTLRARLKAPYMLRYSADTAFLEFPMSLLVDFFDSSGRVESQLNARYGKHFETRGKVYLRDSVIVFNIKGDTLRCPELWWDQNTKKFYTDKFVRITQPDKIIFGHGMEAEQDLSRYSVFKPTGIIIVSDSLR